jgi:hypothetical protein
MASSMALSLPGPVSWAVKQPDAGSKARLLSAAAAQQQRGCHTERSCHRNLWQARTACAARGATFTAARSVTFTLAVGLAAATAFARTALPAGLRALSRHASPELYQLTLIAFCLLCGWLSGYMARPPRAPRALFHTRACARRAARRSCIAGPGPDNALLAL